MIEQCFTRYVYLLIIRIKQWRSHINLKHYSHYWHQTLQSLLLTPNTTVTTDTKHYSHYWHQTLQSLLTPNTTVTTDTKHYSHYWHQTLQSLLTPNTTVTTDTKHYSHYWHQTLPYSSNVLMYMIWNDLFDFKQMASNSEANYLHMYMSILVSTHSKSVLFNSDTPNTSITGGEQLNRTG